MADGRKFKIGDRVIIVGHEKTDRRYGTNSNMMDMLVGRKVYKVQDCDMTAVQVEEFYWHPDDVQSVNELIEEPEPKIFHYDISNLGVE